MQLALMILGFLFAGLILLLVLALALPVDVRFRLSRSAELRFAADVRAFGGWGPWVKITPGKKKPKPKPPAQRHKKKRKKWSMPVNRPWQDVFAAVKCLISDLLGAFSIHELRVEGEFGAYDPADTGAIYGMLAPFVYSPCGQVNISPNFEGPCLKGQCVAVLRFTPFALAPPFLRFGWTLWGPKT
ncbi:MAG: DUF2953 domain-containing protein [Silicimonas sp.]|nr:DUF2953 domain-containing protein [Silicimonas sp.]